MITRQLQEGPMTISWYAVHAQPNGENKAEQHLIRQGFEVYLPRYRKKRSHARKIDWIKAPLFPRYLFVGMDVESARWRAIQSTVGVSHLICSGTRPLEVPRDIIDTLKSHENDHGLLEFKAAPKFVPGDKIQILDGPFSENVAVLEKLDDQQRVTLLLELMGREVKVKTTLESIAACG